MIIEFTPKITFSAEERKIADYFCGICDELAEKINDESNPEELYEIVENNIMLCWDDFFTTVQRFTSFIASCEE